MEKAPLGTIFGTIAYYDKNQLCDIVENISFEQSYFYITQALTQSYNSGLFTLQEAEILSKSLRVMSATLSDKNKFGE